MESTQVRKPCGKCGEPMRADLEQPCDECRFKRARAQEGRFQRKRAIRKESKKVRGRLGYLRDLIAKETTAFGRGAVVLANLSRLETATARVAEAERMLKEVRRSIRDDMARDWTPAEIEAACNALAERTVSARIAAGSGQ